MQPIMMKIFEEFELLEFTIEDDQLVGITLTGYRSKGYTAMHQGKGIFLICTLLEIQLLIDSQSAAGLF
ncbi:Uncharacterised protein [Lysinibacillus sphaericus]|nr:Uncharacterised protein [Lysinibacillus sphaericus]